MEKFQPFENWLKANNYVSWKDYMSFIRTIDKTLMIKDFERIKLTSLLDQLLMQLQSNRSFAARTKTDRDNILSGFRLYIKFIREKNASKGL